MVLSTGKASSRPDRAAGMVGAPVVLSTSTGHGLPGWGGPEILSSRYASSHLLCEQPPVYSVAAACPALKPCCLQVEEKCPQCGNPELEFHTMQLRSADEGTTVFYECRECG